MGQEMSAGGESRQRAPQLSGETGRKGCGLQGLSWPLDANLQKTTSVK